MTDLCFVFLLCLTVTATAKIEIVPQSEDSAESSNFCVDLHSECELWRSMGECSADPVNMNEGCARTCGTCPYFADGGIRNQWTFVINTPKSGTGTLQQSFVDSQCYGVSSEFQSSFDVKGPRGVAVDMCDDVPNESNMILRSHHLESAEGYLQFLQRVSPSSTARCLVVTSIRDPHTWLPSLFFQNHRDFLCKSNTSVTEVLDEYRHWLLSPHPAAYIVPKVLKMFEGGHNFTDVLYRLRKSSLQRTQSRGIGQPDSTGLSGAGLRLKALGVSSPWAKSQCEVLVLRLEDSAHWPAELAAVSPGFRMRRGEATASGDCAATGEAAYTALKKYRLEKEELETLLSQDPSGGFTEAWNFYEERDTRQQRKRKLTGV